MITLATRAALAALVAAPLDTLSPHVLGVQDSGFRVQGLGFAPPQSLRLPHPRMWLVLLSTAGVTSSPGVVVDPKRDDLALRLSRCNVSHPQCHPDRVCAVDRVYSRDAGLNCTCGTDERGHAQCYMCLHTKFSDVQSSDLLGTVAIFFGGVLAGMSGIGGGGLISGNTVAIKGLKPQVRVWGVETDGAATMKSSMDAGKVVNITPTSLSRTLGSPFVAQDALTIAQEHLEDLLIVSDKQAIEAQQLILERTKVMPELAASCTLAAVETIKDRFGPDDHLVLLMCGGNESVANLVNYSKMI